MSGLRRTPLFEVYQEHGARLVDFGGWELPVQYAGIREEHLAVRERAGIFDVSHMGELRVFGPGALELLQYAATTDASRLQIGQAQYSALLDSAAGIIDDIFIYRLGPEDYLLCVNASNSGRDFEWLSDINLTGYMITNESSDWAQIALQGPRATEIFEAAGGRNFSKVPRHHIVPLKIAGVDVMAARSGYTGEPGPEIFIPSQDAVKVWKALIAAGADHGLVPAGLGARDTLRLEMGYALHGHDITRQTTPLEADLMWIVDLGKPDFIGKAALEKQLAEGAARKRVGLVMTEPGIPRDGCRIVAPHGEGKVTSGTKTPSVPAAVALGYVPLADAAAGTEVGIEIRGKLKTARVEPPPFYKK